MKTGRLALIAGSVLLVSSLGGGCLSDEKAKRTSDFVSYNLVGSFASRVGDETAGKLFNNETAKEETQKSIGGFLIYRTTKDHWTYVKNNSHYIVKKIDGKMFIPINGNWVLVPEDMPVRIINY